MKGDLIYLDVVTLDDKKYCITGTPAGFYVNRCDDTQFDPSPAKEPCKDYTLIGLLSQLIPSFRKNFASLTKACIKDHVIEHCPSLFTVNVWVSQRQQHTKDSLRADDAVNMWSLVQGDELTGQNREWHEELMQVREMPKTTLQQRINRMRLLFKWTTDFVAVATKACCLAVDGNIYPLNPTAEERQEHMNGSVLESCVGIVCCRMLMYHWNNVLLIYAKDTGLYSEVGGDEAAHVMAVRNMWE
jgi:protein TIF31